MNAKSTNLRTFPSTCLHQKVKGQLHSSSQEKYHMHCNKNKGLKGVHLSNTDCFTRQ